jgi:hypothetical protein
MLDAMLTKLEADLRTGFDNAVTELVATTRMQLDGALTEIAKERAKGLAEVAKERSDLHREVEAMHKHKEAQEGHVELNVGGYRFETSVQTLRQLPHTFFDAYFSGRYAQDVCADGSIFIDRDGEHFGQVLQYLRDGVVAMAEQEASELNVSVLRWLKREFGFYCIDLFADESAVVESVYVVGGSAGGDKLSSVNRYDASSGSWHITAPMTIERCEIGLCELAGDLYATGGSDEGTMQMERYDQSLDTWSAAPPMPCPRYGHCACVVGEDMYVLGGSAEDEGIVEESVLKFDSETQTWNEVAPMLEGRYLAATCVIGSKVYVFGGKDKYLEPTDTTFCFSTETGDWTTLAPMPEEKRDHRACAVDGLIYVVGGFRSNDVLASVHRFNPTTNVWSELASMCTARSAFGAFVLGGSLYAVGGWFGHGELASAERYSVATDSWSEVCDMALVEGRHSFGLVATGTAGEVNLFDSLMAKAKRSRS